MAKMHGFELKNHRTYHGHEGETLAEGDVWFNGKKLGHWAQDTWGGPAHIDFKVDVLDAEVAKLKGVTPFEEWVDITPDTVSLLEYLSILRDEEALYKKSVKSGYSVLYKFEYAGYAVYFGATDKDDPAKCMDAFMNAAMREFGCNASDIAVAVYDEDSFTIGAPLNIDRKYLKGLADERRAYEKRIKELYAQI